VSEGRRPGDGGQSPEDGRQPVTGGALRSHRAGHHRRDHHAAFAGRRDAVLRVLLEAYRRDLGPSAVDPV
jgi:hypothetical protein